MTTLNDQLRILRANFDLEFHESFVAFLKACETIYGADSQASIEMDEMKVWSGVSRAGPPAPESDDEESEEYWVQDIAEIYRLDCIIEMLTEAEQWSSALSPIGYPIARGYGGAVYFQGVDGEIWHGWGDEWIEDEDHTMLGKMGVSDFCEEWGHHHIATNYEAFYKLLCEQRGASI